MFLSAQVLRIADVRTAATFTAFDVLFSMAFEAHWQKTFHKLRHVLRKFHLLWSIPLPTVLCCTVLELINQDITDFDLRTFLLAMILLYYTSHKARWPSG